ncbi:MAG: hypothetical protein QG602_988 [Verrucomicrobiota bacterium]|nr:hypothetical protein [Verrucomicrobiota bacterium]
MLLTRIFPADLFEAAKELPGTPSLLIDLGILIKNPGTDTHDVTELIKQDPALAARMIRMANSAVYARAVPVASIEGAVSCIGFTELHRLVGALTSTQLTEQRLELYGIGGSRLRNISLFTALLMEELAVPARESPGRCYTIGLLRSIGMMALDIVGRRQGHVPPYNPGSEQPIDEWENCHWGMNNCEAAGFILEAWRLPTEAVAAVLHHYRPSPAHPPLVHLLSLAAGAASDRYQGIPGEETYWHPSAENFRLAGITVQDFVTAADKAQETFQRVEAALA